MEYLLLLGGITLLLLIVGTTLFEMAQGVYGKIVTAQTAAQEGISQPTSQPPQAFGPPQLSFAVVPEQPYEGNTVTLECNATDQDGLAEVNIYLNGTLVRRCGTTSPTSFL